MFRNALQGSVADPGPKDSYHFSGSGSEILPTDPDPNLNLAHLPHPFSENHYRKFKSYTVYSIHYTVYSKE